MKCKTVLGYPMGCVAGGVFLAWFTPRYTRRIFFLSSFRSIRHGGFPSRVYIPQRHTMMICSGNIFRPIYQDDLLFVVFQYDAFCGFALLGDFPKSCASRICWVAFAIRCVRASVS